MTEAEWDACTDPVPMLEFLEASGRADERKLRLFACACSRRAEDPNSYGPLGEPEYWEVLALAERYADGMASAEELRDAEPCKWDESCSWIFANSDAAFAARWLTRADSEKCSQAEKAAILRCVFGNPFRPVIFTPSWKRHEVVALARGIYEDQTWQRLPLLGDTLGEAGCDNVEILGHCRGPGPHARGCWVVDAVLGRE